MQNEICCERRLMNMAEKLCVCAVCQNDEAFWCCDVIIGGLHRVDKFTGKIRCVVSPRQMYQEGFFSVRKLLCWRDKILILPTELNRKWIVYDIATEKIRFIHPVSFPYFSEETIIVGTQAFCVPFVSDKPVLVLDMDTMQCMARLDIFYEGEKTESPFEIWNASVLGNGICFLMRDSNCLCRINGRDVKTIMLDIPETAGCADFYGDEGWVLTSGGTNLYRIDTDGKCLGRIPMKIRQEFVRLAATPRYIFLLPREGSTISVYDQYMQCFKYINSDKPEVGHLLPEPLYVGAYWDYMISENQIYFMQCKYALLIVDLDTLEYRQRDLHYSESFSKKNYWNYYWWIQQMYRKEFKEPMMYSLKGYLKMVTYNRAEACCDGVENSKIWECLKGSVKYRMKK